MLDFLERLIEEPCPLKREQMIMGYINGRINEALILNGDGSDPPGRWNKLRHNATQA